MLTIGLLGELELSRDGAALKLPPSKKTCGLLAYLILAKRAQRREHLCDIFWERPDDPRGALRWSLSRLRRLVNVSGEERIVVEGDTVWFESAGAAIDVLALRDAVSGGVEDMPTDALKSLAAQFRGDLLEGLGLPDCMEFQAWLVAEREECRSLQARVLSALLSRRELSQGDAIAYARSWVDVDPANSDAHVTLVSQLAAAGRAEEAETQYRSSAEILEASGHRSVAKVLAVASKATLGPRVPTARAVPAATDPASKQDIRFCTARDGSKIAFARVGQGLPLVKASNWLTHLEYELGSPVWRHWIEGLATNHELIRYDERGSGLSDWDVDDISFDAFVDDLDAVADAAGLETFALLGISRGCAIAIEYAYRHPERVTSMVLYGGFAKGWRLRGSPETVARGEALLTLMKHGWGQENPAFRQVFTSLYLPGGEPEQMEWFNELMRISTTPENAVRIRNVTAAINVKSRLPNIKVPTLVLHGREDAVSPFEEGRKLAAEIPGARFVSLESRNHLLRADEPAWPRFLSEVRKFLDAEGSSQL